MDKKTRKEAIALLQEFRLFFDEPWGTTMYWWFTIADELYWERDDPPEHWEFKPSPIGPSNDPDDYATVICKETGTDALVFCGNVLYRYAKVLKRAGLSY